MRPARAAFLAWGCFLILAALVRASVRSEAGGGMEIITGVERRRRWREEDKLRIVAEAERPGARFIEVARRHEVSRGLLWLWRDRARRGVLVAEPAPVFVPVQVTADPPAPRLEPPSGPSA